MSKNNLVHVGSFKVTSGNLFVSDPCYTRDSAEGTDPCSAIVSRAAKGIWQVHTRIDEETGRVAALVAVSNRYGSLKSQPSIDVLDYLCVDSGQMGIFDDCTYPDGDRDGHYDNLDTFYGQCCALTGSHQAGVLKNGAVSSSGWGDGCYVGIVQRNENGLALAVEVEFISNSEET